MKVAVIGGGAAGMVAAYLLDEVHEITVLEKQPILGGNIRTLNKNVKDVALDSALFLDNGVIEFLRNDSPSLTKLLQELNVPLLPIMGGATSIFLEDGRFWKTPGAIRQNFPSKIRRGYELLRLLRFAPEYARLRWQARMGHETRWRDRPVSELFGDSILSRWLKMLLMYGYSIPYPQISQFPVEMAFSILRECGPYTRWSRIEGGVYTYIEAILSRFRGKILCGVDITNVSRQQEGVTIHLQGTEPLVFDKVIFATPPDQVLSLLSHPEEWEQRCFETWQANFATTIIHTDQTIYQPYGVTHFTEFDLFEKEAGQDAAYNAYLNRLTGLTGKDTPYFLAYHLEERIDPQSIIHTQRHHTPLYTAESLHFRRQVLEMNGKNHTYHAGAYLKNGLHEGAIASAAAVARLLGGNSLL